MLLLMNPHNLVLVNLVRKSPKKFFLLSLRKLKKLLNKNLSPSTIDTPSVVEDLADISTSPDSESHEEKGPSYKIKSNHPPEAIVRNMNEFTLKKRTIDKCVANFVSYSCYLSQVEPTKLRKLFRMKVGLKLCMMNCFSFKGMMSGL